MKRRQLITSVAALAGSSTIFGRAALAALDKAHEARIDNQVMARDRFEARLGRHFAARGGGIDASLRLCEVGSTVAGREQEQFNVVFDGPVNLIMPERIYLLENNGHAEYTLHLLPGEVVSGRQKMIAVINLQTAA